MKNLLNEFRKEYAGDFAKPLPTSTADSVLRDIQSGGGRIAQHLSLKDGDKVDQGTQFNDVSGYWVCENCHDPFHEK